MRALVQLWQRVLQCNFQFYFYLKGRARPPFFNLYDMDNFKEEMGHLAPQFMGQQLGKVSIEAVRSLIKKQKRIKGYSFTAPVGSSSFNLDLSGTARVLLGLAFFGKGTGAVGWQNFIGITTVQFQVNNEIVIDQLNPNFLTMQFNNNEYYYLPRPLSGTDELTLKFLNSGAVAEEINVVIYYL